MTALKQKLNSARPKLSVVSPLVYRLTWGMVFVNISVGLSLDWQRSVSTNPLITAVIPNGVWAWIFYLLAASFAYSLIRNDWEWIRRTMTVALFIKAVWGMALLVLTVVGSATTVGILGIWLFLAWCQAWCLIRFLPPQPVMTPDEKEQSDGLQSR